MYYKQSTGTVIVRKSIGNASWVKWVHHSQGPNCCQECLKLDGCLFLETKAPIWPHHPNCHCTLDPVVRVGRKQPRSGRKEMTNSGQKEIANSPVGEFLI